MLNSTLPRRPRASVFMAGGLAVWMMAGAIVANAQTMDTDVQSMTTIARPAEVGNLDTAAPTNAPAVVATPSNPAPSSTGLTSLDVRRDTIQGGIAPLTDKPATESLPIAPTLTVTPPTSAPPTVVPEETPVVKTEAPAEATPQQAEADPIELKEPKVVDTANLKSGETSVTLAGIDGLGGASAAGLQSFLVSAGNVVSCQPKGTAGFTCFLPDGTDVAQVALVNGAAKTRPDASASYHDQEAAAQAARRGIWVNLPPPPVSVMHPIVKDTATLLAADGKIYMLEGIEGFGRPYADQLQGYVKANGDTLMCSQQSASDHFVCLLPDGTDLAKSALVNGAARVSADAEDSYRLQQLDALNNRRGFWATANDTLLASALQAPHRATYTLISGDDGADGITYVGGAPVVTVGEEQVFLVYGDNLGWGYYDHYHHWHGAPDRFVHHMEHFHPEGRGLRSYEGLHREAAFRQEAFHGGPAGFRPGFAPHPGMPGRPEMAAHNFGGPARGPMGGNPMMNRPGGGFIRPAMAGPMGGFHPQAAPMRPAAAPMRTAAAAPHPAAAPSGGGHHR